MNQTSLRIEKHLANMHDVYSKAEVEEMLISLRLAVEADAVENSTVLSLERVQDVVFKTFEEMVNDLKIDVKEAINSVTFKESVSLEVTYNHQIEIEVDEEGLERQLTREIMYAVPTPESFRAEVKERLEQKPSMRKKDDLSDDND